MAARSGAVPSRRLHLRMATMRETNFRNKANTLMQRDTCNWYEWSERIASLGDLLGYVLQCSPQFPDNLKLLDGVTEAGEIIKAYQKHAEEHIMVEEEKERKECLINLIRYYFLAHLRVLKESYKQLYGSKAYNKKLKGTILKGLQEFWKLTGAPSALKYSEANDVIDSVAYSDPLICIIVCQIGARGFEFPIHYRPFRTLGRDFRHEDNQEKTLLQLGRRFKLPDNTNIQRWDSDAASASRIVEATLGYRLSRKDILYFLGHRHHKSLEPAYQLIHLGEVEEVRHEAVVSALTLKEAVSVGCGTQGDSSGQTGGKLHSFRFTNECMAYSNFCNDNLVVSLNQRLTLKRQEPWGKFVARLDADACLSPTEGYINVLLPLFDETQIMKLQAPNSGEKVVFSWPPDMALWFHKYDLELPEGKLRYVHLLYESDAVEDKSGQRTEQSHKDTSASGYGPFCMPKHSVSLHPDLFMSSVSPV
ncbi:hypothetical protein VFPPC_11956 [Pochonia chlamydosporia 170]|uniref:Uncharacterized protein n=1 Tax=Pochonia chlamydosporia 170 TaxID=1380566 RepID=A0A179F0V7_METCM|nr:hypothetical protein VFPPC_11956 [Pochonia chlamydosporia 170]OAQ59032.1 hypothetical protein VFPPC_11956 [Pochonia chlamydosporia 170]